MAKIPLLVLSKPDDPYLPLLLSLEGRAEITIGDDPGKLKDAASQARVVLNWGTGKSVLEAVFPLAPKLEWLHSRYAGLDSLLFPALIESPVPMTNSKGVYSQSLGEFVIAGALYFAKDIARMRRNQVARKWAPFVVEELRGATMGIAGYGDIGRAAAQRAHALGMRVLAMRRRPALTDSDPYIDETYSRDGFIEMIGQCDYIVAAAPLTPETRGMIGQAEFAAMKPTAVVMNVGRGPVIDEPALLRALLSKSIRGAALDVFTTEPLPPEHPIFGFDNVLISPHCADNTPTWNQDAMAFFLANFERFEQGLELDNVVDKNAGY